MIVTQAVRARLGDGKWHHLAKIVELGEDSTVTRIYVDGELVFADEEPAQ